MKERIIDFWEAVVETMDEGLMIVNPEGVIVFVNRALEDLVGYSRDEITGKKCTILNCDICEGIQQGRSFWCDLFRLKDIKKKRCVLMRKDGRRIQVLKNATLLYDKDGEVLGAIETLTDLSEVLKREKQIEEFRKELRAEDQFCGIIGKSSKMKQLFQLIENAAKSDAPVIIYGESGTGKELVANAIHQLGNRKNGPFVKVNLAALSENLFESELFGHVKGAFTGAYHTRKGRFELADGGDIFLDEIGDLPEFMQVKLLRVLEEKVIERVGDNRSIPVDVRIISATNKDLDDLVKKGKFRKDFYYRINVIPIHLPPLRDRKDDLPLLVEHFIRRNRLKTGKEIHTVSKDVMKLFFDYSWPGNIRELKSVIEYAFVVCNEPVIKKEHIYPVINKNTSSSEISNQMLISRNNIEKSKLIEALNKSGGNRTKAAKMLGISRVTLWKKMKRYDLL